jgi:hypothetical protein
VFSFLEFAVERHWSFFEAAVDRTRAEKAPAIVLLSRDAIAAWAAHLPVTVEAIHAGDVPHVALPHPIQFDGGPRFERLATLGPVGQSVGVLRRI